MLLHLVSFNRMQNSQEGEFVVDKPRTCGSVSVHLFLWFISSLINKTMA